MARALPMPDGQNEAQALVIDLQQETVRPVQAAPTKPDLKSEEHLVWFMPTVAADPLREGEGCVTLGKNDAEQLAEHVAASAATRKLIDVSPGGHSWQPHSDIQGGGIPLNVARVDLELGEEVRKFVLRCVPEEST